MPRSPVVPIEKPLTLRTPQSLVEAGLAPPAALEGLQDVATRYAIAVTPAMADLVDPADPADPIARQFLPDSRELDHRPEERADPIGDDAHSPLRGPGASLSGPGAFEARPCLRGLLPLLLPSRERWGRAVRRCSARPNWKRPSTISARIPAIWEIVLTGGDPLVVSPRRLVGVPRSPARDLEHVRILRFHTRVPGRGSARGSRRNWSPYAASALRQDGAMSPIHANHPREFTPGGEGGDRRVSPMPASRLSARRCCSRA